MKINHIEAPYALYGMLFSLSNRIQTIGDRESKDITLKQKFLLISLGMFEQPPSLREMSELIGCSYQNVKRMASDLEKSGYLHIMQDKTDKRIMRLVLKEKTEKATKTSEETDRLFIERLYQGISCEDMETTLKTLMTMDKNIGGIIE